MPSSRDIVGIVCVVAATVLFLRSHRLMSRGSLVPSLLWLLAGALLLRAFPASDLFLHEWDERYHALVARNFLDDPFRPVLYADPVLPYDHREWLANHVWLHKQPLSLWLIALSYQLFGVNEIALRLPGVLLSTLAVAATFLLGKSLFSNRVGWIAALLHATSGLLIELTAARVPTDHPDTVFLVLAELAVLAAVLGRDRGWAYALLVGALVGLAALAKSPVGLIALLVWVPLLRPHQGIGGIAGRVAVAVIVATVVYLPWQLHVAVAFPEEAAFESEYNVRHLDEALEGHAGGFFYHFGRIPRYFGELSLIPIAMFLIGLARHSDRAVPLALALWFLVPYLFFSLVATKMPGYVMVSAPAIFLLIAAEWVRLRDRVTGWTGGRRLGAIALLVLLLVLPFRYGLERIKPVGGPPWRLEWAEDFREVGRSLQGRRAVVLGVERSIELMFYAPVIAYPQPPTPEAVARCREKGYEVLVWRDGRPVPHES